MKKILMTIAITAFIASISSCSRCKDCTCGIFVSEVCREDFNSSEEYRDGIEDLESLGCECK